MKKTILYTIGTIGALLAGWSVAITVNVNPTANDPVNVKHNYCKPGSTKASSGYTHVCSSNGKWVKTSTPKVRTPHVKTPKVKVRAPSISY